jgi:hypothetical protein
MSYGPLSESWVQVLSEHVAMQIHLLWQSQWANPEPHCNGRGLGCW